MNNPSESLSAATFKKANWMINRAVLVLRVSDDGYPSGLYVITDDGYSTIKAIESSKHQIPESGAAQRALIQIANMDHHDLKPYNKGSLTRRIELKGLARSELEIVQTGMIGDWCDGDIPVGLYPIPLLDLESD